MTKEEVAAVLEEIATLMELRGENPFRCNAYRNGARAVLQIEGNLHDVIAQGKLDKVPGIGTALCEKIEVLVATGTLPFHVELRAAVPAGLIEMLRIPGLGPKKIMAIHKSLGISEPAELRRACEEGRLAELKGFGAKTQKKILEGLEFLGQVGHRVRIDQAMPIGLELLDQVRSLPGVIRAELCGSLRRRRETAKDIDILCSAVDAAPVMSGFAKLPSVAEVTAQGETKSSALVRHFADGDRISLNADLRVVTDEQFPFALHYFTGSKEHNIRVRQRAIDRGLRLNEYELAGAEGPLPCRDERDLFAALELDWIPPELREDTGEIEAAAWVEGKSLSRLPSLIEAPDIRGVFHNHSTWSDGAHSIEEMALAARDLGFEYFGIADHSQSLTIGNGLSPERVRQQISEIDALNQRLRDIFIFRGTECDILPDGSLDYDESTLELFDYVVASVHTHFQLPADQMTQRIIRAIQHPRVTMLGHMTGRLLLRRDGYKVDVDRVLDAAAEAGKMIEINAQPLRLDLDWRYCKRAKSLGIPLVINPDAHRTQELAYFRFGVDVARRGWLERDDVLNTRSLADVRRRLGAQSR